MARRFDIHFIEHEVHVPDFTHYASDKNAVNDFRKAVNNLSDEDFMKFYDYAVRANAEHISNLQTSYDNGQISKEDYEKYKKSQQINWVEEK